MGKPPEYSEGFNLDHTFSHIPPHIRDHIRTGAQQLGMRESDLALVSGARIVLLIDASPASKEAIDILGEKGIAAQRAATNAPYARWIAEEASVFPAAATGIDAIRELGQRVDQFDAQEEAQTPSNPAFKEWQQELRRMQKQDADALYQSLQTPPQQ